VRVLMTLCECLCVCSCACLTAHKSSRTRGDRLSQSAAFSCLGRSPPCKGKGKGRGGKDDRDGKR
jgi:hypothetical protein